jgi:hypothetical protein
MFIESESLVGDGALLDLAMVVARRFFRHASRRRRSWTAAVGFGGFTGNRRDQFVFLDLL